MSEDSHELKVGQLIQHPEFGEGVMASSPVNGTVYFRGFGLYHLKHRSLNGTAARKAALRKR